ncbi:unnamed protein product [Linum tenue]|uniref:BZIP domain-containing protein n=3 Tax=Linum tenue TaxID=586396 RepID=A0AAV0KIE7_9ROSI|nr:unnamed protein product [Linum tenue]
MASSSGNSSFGVSSSLLQNSCSDEDLQQLVMDERKRKRMLSKRESDRRSRMRKQKHLDELVGQVTQLRKDNSQILTTINVTTQHFLNVQTENYVLCAQISELGNRLDSLTEILDFIGNNDLHPSFFGDWIFEQMGEERRGRMRGRWRMESALPFPVSILLFIFGGSGLGLGQLLGWFAGWAGRADMAGKYNVVGRIIVF